MNEGQIKKDANRYFSEENYEETITTLWQVGLDGFIDYCIKKKWFAETEFVEELLKHADIFTSVFDSQRADELLFNYFNSKNQISEKFEREVASKFPELYINAVRVSQVFLDEKRFDFLDTLVISEEFQIHKKVWKHLHGVDKNYWNAIQDNLSKLSKIQISDILTDVIIWLENKRFHKAELDNIDYLAFTYNFFIELFFKKFPQNTISTNRDEFFITLFNKLHEAINQDLGKLLDNIEQWIVFNDFTLSAYCFDLNIFPKEENGIIYFNESPKDFYNRKLNGVRYLINNNEYNYKANEIVNKRIEKGEENIAGKNEYEKSTNHSLAVKKQSLRYFLEDLAIENLIYNKQKIKCESLFEPLVTHSVNGKYRYERLLQKYSLNSNTWQEVFSLLTMESISQKLQVEPYIFMNRSDYKALNAKAMSKLSEEDAGEIINLFTHRVNPKYNFNRLYVNYNVWEKPFLKIGDMLFCPMIFFANNAWFYRFAHVGIKNLGARSRGHKIPENHDEEKRTSIIMEQALGRKFKINDWKVYVTTEEDENKMNGDVDVIIEDNDTTLYIQLKRTFFRLKPKDAYSELINSDRKAAQQLNKAEKYLNTNKEIFNPKHKPVKWIVSTSYENILADINDCKKVNYFDVINSLSQFEGKSLQDFIESIQNDDAIHELISKYNFDNSYKNFYSSSIADVGLPLPLVQSGKYRLAMFAADDFDISYNQMFSKANKLNLDGFEVINNRTVLKDKEKVLKAIKIFKKCLYINPEDMEVYASLGNCYANIKDYKQSFMTFERALEIVPNEPRTMYNFAIAKQEAGKFYESLDLLLDICILYPFIENIVSLYENNFLAHVQDGNLSDKEVKLLVDKYMTLNSTKQFAKKFNEKDIDELKKQFFN